MIDRCPDCNADISGAPTVCSLCSAPIASCKDASCKDASCKDASCKDASCKDALCESAAVDGRDASFTECLWSVIVANESRVDAIIRSGCRAQCRPDLFDDVRQETLAKIFGTQSILDAILADVLRAVRASNSDDNDPLLDPLVSGLTKLDCTSTISTCAVYRLPKWQFSRAWVALVLSSATSRLYWYARKSAFRQSKINMRGVGLCPVKQFTNQSADGYSDGDGAKIAGSSSYTSNSADKGPELAVEQADLAEAAMNRLNSREKWLLTCHYQLGYRLADLAKEMGIGYSALYAQYRAALSKAQAGASLLGECD